MFSVDKVLVEYCSPTLAGLKTGSLISFEMKNPDLEMEVRRLNRSFKDKGLRLIPIIRKDRKALLYLYRPARLKEDLLLPEAGSILREKGYPVGNPDVCVSTLIQHLSGDEEFPHEVGLFLGYPPSDVKCFMADSRKGDNDRCRLLSSLGKAGFRIQQRGNCKGKMYGEAGKCLSTGL